MYRRALRILLQIDEWDDNVTVHIVTDDVSGSVTTR